MSALWHGIAARRGALITLGVAFIAAFASIAQLFPNHAGFQSYDSSAYIFVADGMLKGRIPYLQLWENKGMPLYALNILGRLITPGRFGGIWLLELLFVTLAFGGVIWTLRRIASIGATALACALLVVGIVLTAVGGNTPELWNLAAQAAGLVLAWLLISGEWRAKRRLFVLSGFAAGFSGMMKISLLGTWVAVFCLLVALAVARKIALRDALQLLGMMAVGFLVAIALSVAPIAAWGATSAWWDQWIGFGLNMKSHGVTGVRGSRLEALRISLLRLLFISATLVAGLVVAGGGWLARRRPQLDSRRLWMGCFLAGWLGIELWAASINGLSYIHYSMPWLIPLVTLVGLLFGGESVRWPGLVLAVVVVALSLWHVAPEFRSRLALSGGFPPVTRVDSVSRREAQRLMIREVESRTSPSDTVLVWGKDPIVFVETGRLSAGPYSHPLDILLTPGYQSERQFAAFMRDLETNPPRLIIDSAPLWNGDRASIPELRVSTPTDTSAGRVQPYMGSLPDFVSARYRHYTTGNPRIDYYELAGE